MVKRAAQATCEHQHGPDGKKNEADKGNDAAEEDLKLLRVQLAAQVVNEGVDLAQAEDTQRGHVLRGEDGLRVGRVQSHVRENESCREHFLQPPK